MSAFFDAVLDAFAEDHFPAPPPRIYATNAVPASPTYPYSVVGVTLSDAGGYSLCAKHGTRNVRIWVQSFGRTTESAAVYAESADARLIDRSLQVPGHVCGPIRLQVAASMTRDPDDGGVVGVTSAYIFTTTKE